jgi:hypothetical protein
VLEASPLSAQPSKTVAIKAAAGTPVRADWRVGAPIAFERLTIFPVISDQPSAAAEFITLDQGLRSGKVTINELGANGVSRRIHRRQIADGAEVNKLAVINKSGKTLVLIAGEMILGGKQDRIVGHDCIIEASNIPVPLDVFCVEHGRWSGGSGFGQGRDGGVGEARGGNTGNGTGSGSGSGDRSGGGVQTDQGRMSVMMVAPMALPKIREKAQAKKSQGEVWNAVAETVTVNKALSSTGDLKSVYQDKRVNTRLANYEQAFRARVSTVNVVGVVAAVGGRIVSADVFANHALFQAYWPKMLKSYALEAVSTVEATRKQVSRSDAEAFLARTQGARAADGKEGVYRLAENQSEADASFELQYTRNTPTLVHFNRVSKR